MDLSNPDGRGSLKITRMTISEDSTSFDFEGRVEGYGSPFLTHDTFIMRKTGLEVNLSAKHALSSKTAH